jgi:hypothetical protein
MVIVEYISANLHKNVEKELSAISEDTPLSPTITSSSRATHNGVVSREAEAFHRAFLATDQAMAHERLATLTYIDQHFSISNDDMLNMT